MDHVLSNILSAQKSINSLKEELEHSILEIDFKKYFYFHFDKEISNNNIKFNINYLVPVFDNHATNHQVKLYKCELAFFGDRIDWEIFVPICILYDIVLDNKRITAIYYANEIKNSGVEIEDWFNIGTDDKLQGFNKIDLTKNLVSFKMPSCDIGFGDFLQLMNKKYVIPALNEYANQITKEEGKKMPSYIKAYHHNLDSFIGFVQGKEKCKFASDALKNLHQVLHEHAVLHRLKYLQENLLDKDVNQKKPKI